MFHQNKNKYSQLLYNIFTRQISVQSEMVSNADSLRKMATKKTSIVIIIMIRYYLSKKCELRKDAFVNLTLTRHCKGK